MTEFDRTNRGFKIYGNLKDSYQSKIKVQESSIAGKPHAWVFATNDKMDFDNPKPHLDVDQAKELIEILQKFVEDAEDPENWRNDPEYRRKFWGINEKQ